MAKMKPDVIPNQVFIGCPWKTVRPKYDRAIEELRKKYPLSFIIVGREDDQDADDLLTVIKEKLMSSSYAVFDATGGNANVSLEYGIAEASDIDRAIYLSTHKAGSRQSGKDGAIISDLAGKKRVPYKQAAQLQSLLAKLCTNHPYFVRFERFLHREFNRVTKGQKKSNRALALKLLHQLDDAESRRRDDVVQAILAEGYDRTEIDKMISQLQHGGLIDVTPGRYSSVTIR